MLRRVFFPKHCHNNLIYVALCACFSGTRGSYLPEISQRQATYDYTVETSGVEGKFTERFNYMLEKQNWKILSL